MKDWISSMVNPPGLCDTLGVVGMALVGMGAWMIWRPACLLVLGLMLTALAIRLAMMHGDKDIRKERRHRRRRRKIEYVTSRNECGQEVVIPRPQIDRGYLCDPDEPEE